MSGWEKVHLEIVSKMVRSKVAGAHHKQRDTIKGWCGGYDGDVIDEAIDELVAAGLIREKRRGTITLRSIGDGKNFLQNNDENGDYTWFY